MAAVAERTFPAGQAPWWQLPVPRLSCVPELEAAAGVGGFGSQSVLFLGWGQQNMRGVSPRAGSGEAPAAFSGWPTWPSGPRQPPHRKRSQRARLCGPLNLGARRGGRQWGGCRGPLL